MATTSPTGGTTPHDVSWARSRGLHARRASLMLVAALPSVVVTVLLAVKLSSAVGVHAAVFPVGWLFCCVVLHYRDPALLRRLLRAPSATELPALASAWANVCRAAAVDPAGYSLWVYETAKVNAYCAARGRIVVTTAALTTFSPQQLEAVLAHELGHALLGELRGYILARRYAGPVRLVLTICLTITRSLVQHAHPPRSRFLHAIASAVLIVLVLLIGVVVPMAPLIWILGTATTAPLLVLLVIEEFAVAELSARQEILADRVAVDLGYAEPLYTSYESIDPALGTTPDLATTTSATQAHRKRMRAIRTRADALNR